VKRLLTLMMLFISIALVGPVLAQPGPNPGVTEPGAIPPPGINRRAMRSAASGTFMLIRAYNSKTITTLKGVVQSLKNMPYNSQVPGSMLAAVLKTDQGDITVYMAPAGYLNDRKISLKAGDEVEVTGSKVTLGKQPPSIIVKDLKVGEQSVALRDERGVPLWLEAQPRGPAK